MTNVSDCIRAQPHSALPVQVRGQFTAGIGHVINTALQDNLWSPKLFLFLFHVSSKSYLRVLKGWKQPVSLNLPEKNVTSAVIWHLLEMMLYFEEWLEKTFGLQEHFSNPCTGACIKRTHFFLFAFITGHIKRLPLVAAKCFIILTK